MDLVSLTSFAVFHYLPTIYFDGYTASQGECLCHSPAHNTRLEVQTDPIRNHGWLCVDFTHCQHCRLLHLPTNGFYLGQDYTEWKM